MRVLLCCAFIVVLVGCGRDEVIPPDGVPGQPDAFVPPADGGIDGTPADAMTFLCSSPMDSADVTATGPGGSVHYNRVYAGGVWQTGPIVGQPPMTVTVVFTDDDPIDSNRLWACDFGDTANCNTVGLVGDTQALTFGAEVGTYPVTFRKTDNPTGFTVDGMLTIDMFTQPFVSPPGRIMGSITGTMGGRTVAGTFDNAFCQYFLTQTI
jgi:hypothetical protein